MLKAPAVLVIEDSSADADLILLMLARSSPPPRLTRRAASLSEGLHALTRENFSCVLLDLSLPDAGGLDALLAIQRIVPQIPIVVLTGEGSEATALEALKLGAQDYLVKGTVDPVLLEHALRFAMERKGAELALLHRALHDPLTDLPNRSLYLDRLSMALSRLERRGGAVAVFFADVDSFKAINDTIGHEGGDRVLLEVSRRFGLAVRPEDTVARFSGDEFAVLCEGPFGHDDVRDLADRLCASLRKPLETPFAAIPVTASVGGVVTRDSTARPERLLREADLAMYEAKRRGIGRYEIYDEYMRERDRLRFDVETDLRRALDRSEFRLAYQPIVSLAGGAVLGAEALIRWSRPDGEELGPDQFVPIAEETGLIVPIGAWVLGEACRQVERWRLAGRLRGSMILSVNLSPSQLVASNLLELVTDGLARMGEVQLWLEITESVVLEDRASSVKTLESARVAGARIAVDDFGTGYASLQSLSRFPIDIVKIDGSFVAGMGHNRSDRAIVAAVLGLAADLNLAAVAEGVESRGQVQALRALSCPMAQGFHFAPPMTGEEFASFLGGSLPSIS